MDASEPLDVSRIRTPATTLRDHRDSAIWIGHAHTRDLRALG